VKTPYLESAMALLAAPIDRLGDIFRKLEGGFTFAIMGLATRERRH
jgi:hypothetical protein